MDRWFALTSWIRHRRMALGRYGLHSPYVYALFNDVALARDQPQGVADIETDRKKYRCDPTPVLASDPGAGSSRPSSRTIASVARHALKPPAQAAFLFRLARFHGACRALELGTCLGTTSRYLARGLKPEGQLHTIEGVPEFYHVAAQSFNREASGRIVPHAGHFDEVLPELLRREGHFDFVFLDGNHRYEATMRYVNKIIPYCTPDAMIVLDDIYWSREMARAWNEMRADPRFPLTLDFYHVGILVLSARQQKEDFRLKWPLSLR